MTQAVTITSGQLSAALRLTTTLSEQLNAALRRLTNPSERLNAALRHLTIPSEQLNATLQHMTIPSTQLFAMERMSIPYAAIAAAIERSRLSNHALQHAISRLQINFEEVAKDVRAKAAAGEGIITGGDESLGSDAVYSGAGIELAVEGTSPIAYAYALFLTVFERLNNLEQRSVHSDERADRRHAVQLAIAIPALVLTAIGVALALVALVSDGDAPELPPR